MKASLNIKKRMVFVLVFFQVIILILVARVFYIQTLKAGDLQELALEQHTRDRLISPNRGSILDRNGVGLAVTESVCAISVIPVQTRGYEEKVAVELATRLELNYETVLEKTKKRVALERVKSKVDKEKADEIRILNLPGVVVDEDIKRVYPYRSLASQIIGFVGKDNQGIIGLEAYYDEYLKGSYGKILTETDAKGIELNAPQTRAEPIPGHNLELTIDVNIQQYAEQTLEKIVEAKDAKKGAIIVMNPQNGEILALANKPDFDLNEPFVINDEELKAKWDSLTEKEQNDALNGMWRNPTINDTYEPGSTFKIITSSAGLQEGAVKTTDMFHCNGYHTVGDRMIKCWRSPRSHGSLNFVEGVQNSCNPVFMMVAERLGVELFYSYMQKFGFNEKTGVDLPGEAVAIMHDIKNVGPVELATMSFGQSFQITPLQLLRAVSATINGGDLVTPHMAKRVLDEDGHILEVFEFKKVENVISDEVSETMKEILESVVYVGTGNRTYLPGYRIGGKTATSEKLPRRSGKYIASFLAFAPADDPKLIALVMVDEPKGAYYGGQVTGPVMKELLQNILPYLGIIPEYSEEELKLAETQTVKMPDLIGMEVKEVEKLLKELDLVIVKKGEGEMVNKQFPMAYEEINPKSEIIIYTD